MLRRWTLITSGISLLLLTLITTVSAQDARPDAYWLTFVSTRTKRLDRQIYRMRFDGRMAQQLTFGPQTRLYPDWSPDGQYISFTSFEEGDTEIFRVPATGGVMEQVTATDRSNGYPDFSTDGTRLVFSSTRDFRSSQIYVRDLESEVDTRLTEYGAANIAPVWSPDGMHVAFITMRHGPPEIYRMDVDNGVEMRLTDSRGSNWYPDWSPDGQWITFASDRTGVMQIYRMRADGTQVEQITFEGTGNTMPTWSPGGEWIAYVSERDAKIEIWRMRPDGSDKTMLTDSPGDDMFPAWGPIEYDQQTPLLPLSLGAILLVLGCVGRNSSLVP
jgi:TolB protein